MEIRIRLTASGRAPRQAPTNSLRHRPPSSKLRYGRRRRRQFGQRRPRHPAPQLLDRPLDPRPRKIRQHHRAGNQQQTAVIRVQDSPHHPRVRQQQLRERVDQEDRIAHAPDVRHRPIVQDHPGHSVESARCLLSQPHERQRCRQRDHHLRVPRRHMDPLRHHQQQIARRPNPPRHP